VRESAPMTTPPSYSTAMMVVCRGKEPAGGSASTMSPHHGKARRWQKEEKSERLRFAASLFPSPSYGPGREHASGPMPRRRGKRRCSTYPESRVLDVRAGPGHVARRRRHL
jgi:hypothetical protein